MLFMQALTAEIDIYRPSTSNIFHLIMARFSFCSRNALDKIGYSKNLFIDQGDFSAAVQVHYRNESSSLEFAESLLWSLQNEQAQF